MEGMCVRSDSDRISDLPGDVIDQILACLPIKDVVRTSTLSKKWKTQWYTVPRITVDNRPFHKRYQKTMGGIISYILTRHQGKIDNFSLSVEQVEDPFNLKMWICRLSQKSIQELTLLNPCCPCREVPSDLFSCQQLRKLNLYHFEFKRLPISFRGFGNLVSLELTSVYITSPVFTKLIASCLQLEQLTVMYLHYTDHLRIIVPSLKYFMFLGRFKSISFKTPLLEVLYLCWPDSLHEKFDKKIRGFPPSIKELYVGCKFCKLLGGWENTLTQVPTSYNHLKTLELPVFCSKKLFDISCLLSLMESALNLETLVITIYRFSYKSGDEPGKILKFWEDGNHSSLSFNRLQEVTVSSFRGIDNEVKFVRFLLAHSPVLKKITYCTQHVFS